MRRRELPSGGIDEDTTTGSHHRPSVSPGAPLPHRVPSSWARCVGSDPVRLSAAPDFRDVAIAGEPRSYEDENTCRTVLGFVVSGDDSIELHQRSQAGADGF